MAGDFVLHLDNRLVAGKPLGATGLVASSTANGYNIDNIRDANLFTGWKPQSSNIDETATFELSTALSNGSTYYFGAALDARGQASATGKNRLLVQGSTGGAYTTLATLSFGPGLTDGLLFAGAGVIVVGAAYTFIRFTLSHSSGGATVRDAPILHYVSLCGITEALDVRDSGPQPGPALRSYEGNLAIVRTVARAYLTNRSARQQQDLTINFPGCTDGVYDTLADLLGRFNVSGRCLFANIWDSNEFNILAFPSAIGGDCVVRVGQPRWASDKFYQGAQNVQLPIVSEPYSVA